MSLVGAFQLLTQIYQNVILLVFRLLRKTSIWKQTTYNNALNFTMMPLFLNGYMNIYFDM